jgi:hypothetical protein
MGLIEQEMQQDLPPEAEQAPMPDEVPAQASDGVDEDNPAFQAAMQLTYDALYKQGAADKIHQQLMSADNPAHTMADIAYEITSMVDERTEGQVPDELMILLASNSLTEVGDIALASGIEIAPAELAEAMKQMILRFVGEMGHDTRQLQEAMDAIPPEQFNEMVQADEQPMPPQEPEGSTAPPMEDEPPEGRM